MVVIWWIDKSFGNDPIIIFTQPKSPQMREEYNTRTSRESKRSGRDGVRDADMTGSSATSRPIVLVIDDNKDLTEVMCDYFDSQNILCKIINEGRKGLEEIRNEGVKYTVILLDLAMPEFSGYDVIDVLKKENVLDSKNIVVFTASSVTDMQIQELVARGAKGVLKKPVSLDDLNELMEKYASESR